MGGAKGGDDVVDDGGGVVSMERDSGLREGVEVCRVEDVERGQVGVKDIGKGSEDGEGDAEEGEEIHGEGRYEKKGRSIRSPGNKMWLSTSYMFWFVYMLNYGRTGPGPVEGLPGVRFSADLG